MQVRIVPQIAKHEIDQAKGFDFAKIEQGYSHLRHEERIRLQTRDDRGKPSEQPPGARQMQTAMNHAIKADEQARNHNQRMFSNSRIKGKRFFKGGTPFR
jgi:hypothetical protein